MRVEPIESESMGVEYVTSFVAFVYEAMCSADVADDVAGMLRSLIERVEALGATESELQRYRRTAAKGTDLVEQIKTEAIAAAALVPTLLRASAFDTGLDRMTAQWTAAAKCAARIETLRERLARSAVPCARRAAALAFAADAAGSISAEDLSEILNEAGLMFVMTDGGLSHREVMRVKSGSSMVSTMVGAAFHAMMVSDALMMVRRVDRPEQSVRFSSRSRRIDIVEIAGSPEDPRGPKLSVSQARALKALGFGAPTTKDSERYWHRNMSKRTIPEVAVAIITAFQQIYGLTPGERLEVVTRPFIQARR